ncbi:hypothetical protein B878_18945 [Vibrio campbellii CAIM 519 = NBRC 15631 = ATCC 25920]|nr:hypothetical protein B878_18945 [Vibrio campbellii CAIM 519 = NBRC 15631 = ATCC 25920]
MKMVLLAAKGWSMTIISAALCIRESTVVRHLIDYALTENLKLKPENGGSHRMLD